MSLSQDMWFMYLSWHCREEFLYSLGERFLKKSHMFFAVLLFSSVCIVVLVLNKNSIVHMMLVTLLHCSFLILVEGPMTEDLALKDALFVVLCSIHEFDSDG